MGREEEEEEEQPVPELLMRLGSDHGLFREYLLEAERQSSLGNLYTAMSWVSLIRPKILKHFATEEERLTTIMSQGGETLGREKLSELLRQHRKLSKFLTVKLPYLVNLNPGGAKEEFDDFVHRLKRQMEAEEQLAFPLVRAAGLVRARSRFATEATPDLQENGKGQAPRILSSGGRQTLLSR